MPISWELFKNNLLLYFDTNLNSQDTSDMLSDVAIKITDEYELAVQQGSDLNYNNPVTTYVKAGLQLNIEQAFRSGYAAPDGSVIPQIFGGFFSIGMVQFWTGGQLGFLIPPPGTVGIVSNVVAVPGTALPILNFNTESEDKEEFIDAMIEYFKNHLQTLNGITTALVPQPTGPPIPVPFPWTGYG